MKELKVRTVEEKIAAIVEDVESGEGIESFAHSSVHRGIQDVESGEGIESEWRNQRGSGGEGGWNPVKELKEIKLDHSVKCRHLVRGIR